MLISYEIKKNINNIDLLIIKIIIESNIAIDLLAEIIKFIINRLIALFLMLIIIYINSLPLIIIYIIIVLLLSI